MLILLIILAVCFFVWHKVRQTSGTDTGKIMDHASQVLSDIQSTPIEEAEFIRVIDGDTLLAWVNGCKERVRLIGIDAPESVHPDDRRNSSFGRASSRFVRTTIGRKRYIYLEYDAEKRDKYGRLLAYVYIDTPDGVIMLNRRIIQEGYAWTITVPPNTRYAALLASEQAKARKAKKGFWAYR